MNQIRKITHPIVNGIVCCGLLTLALVAGCISPGPVQGAVVPAVAPSPGEVAGTVVAFTAASLKGATPRLAADFAGMYPGRRVAFNIDGTQALKTQVENGAHADIFISASSSYTNTLNREGFFRNGTVKPLIANYVIVILPASNPGKIASLEDLSRPGLRIAMGDKTVPAGAAARAVLANVATSVHTPEWKTSVLRNVVTYEMSEPGIATKVALGEADAGFVYESTYTAAPAGTFVALTIPEQDNYLQTYTIGVLEQSANKGAAADFETFMLSDIGQKDLRDYGFRPAPPA